MQKITSISEIVEAVKGQPKKTIAVAAAQDAEVLKAVHKAVDYGLANAILVGDSDKIQEILSEEGVSPQEFEIIHEPDKAEACKRAVMLVSENRADILMKGIVDTSVILKAVLNKEYGLRKAAVLSHVAVFEVDGYDRLFLVTDAAMNIAPDVSAKKEIIESAVSVAHSLGLEHPIAACICAVEKVNPKMQATLDARELVEMNQRGDIPGCTVAGPFALDNAVSEEAANHKGIEDVSAGRADILLVPQIEAGNVLYKSLVFFARAKNAGIIIGAKVPVVVTSRADSEQAKLNSIALALLTASEEKKGE